MTQHTLAPWFRGFIDANRHELTIGTAMGRICTVLPSAESEANARLIAASPLLYDALERCLNNFDLMFQKGILMESDLAGMIEQARAAIKSAKGE